MRRAWVNEIGSDNEMAMELAELTKKLALLTSKKASIQLVCGFCITYGHGACPCSFVVDLYRGTSQEQVHSMEGHQPRSRNEPMKTCITQSGGIIPTYVGRETQTHLIPKTKWKILF